MLVVIIKLPRNFVCVCARACACGCVCAYMCVRVCMYMCVHMRNATFGY